MIVKSTLSAVNYVWIPVTKLKMQGHDDHEGDDDHDVVGALCTLCPDRFGVGSSGYGGIGNKV